HKVRLPYDVNFRFLKQGIQIRSGWFPIVKMQWAEGDLLHVHVEKQLRYPGSLASLRAKWATLVRDLETARVAHGDLQHGNILVREDFLQVGRSEIWQQLRRIGSAQIDQLAAAMGAMLQQPPMKVSTLDSVLRNLASYKVPASPAASAASPPAQRVASKPPPV